MNIAGTQYTLKDRAFEIYLSGCTIHCKGCHNPEIQSFSYGEEFTVDKLDEISLKIKESGDLIQSIRILGGEPLDQDYDEFVGMLQQLYCVFPDKKLILFTGYDITEIESKMLGVAFVFFDEIKFGQYREDLRVEGEFLASSNQGIWIKQK